MKKTLFFIFLLCPWLAFGKPSHPLFGSLPKELWPSFLQWQASHEESLDLEALGYALSDEDPKIRRLAAYLLAKNAPSDLARKALKARLIIENRSDLRGSLLNCLAAVEESQTDLEEAIEDSLTVGDLARASLAYEVYLKKWHRSPKESQVTRWIKRMEREPQFAQSLANILSHPEIPLTPSQQSELAKHLEAFPSLLNNLDLSKVTNPKAYDLTQMASAFAFHKLLNHKPKGQLPLGFYKPIWSPTAPPQTVVMWLKFIQTQKAERTYTPSWFIDSSRFSDRWVASELLTTYWTLASQQGLDPWPQLGSYLKVKDDIISTRVLELFAKNPPPGSGAYLTDRILSGTQKERIAVLSHLDKLPKGIKTEAFESALKKNLITAGPEETMGIVRVFAILETQEMGPLLFEKYQKFQGKEGEATRMAILKALLAIKADLLPAFLRIALQDDSLAIQKVAQKGYKNLYKTLPPNTPLPPPQERPLFPKELPKAFPFALTIETTKGSLRLKLADEAPFARAQLIELLLKDDFAAVPLTPEFTKAVVLHLNTWTFPAWEISTFVPRANQLVYQPNENKFIILTQDTPEGWGSYIVLGEVVAGGEILSLLSPYDKIRSVSREKLVELR